MSVLISDICVYGSVNMPEDPANTLAVGGAVDFTRRVDFSDFIAPAGVVTLISSSASDSAVQCKYAVRDPTGAVRLETLTATGVTPSGAAIGTLSGERFLYGLLSGATANGPNTAPAGTLAVGDVALAQQACVLPSGTLTTDASIQTAQAAAANHTISAPALFQLAAGQAAVLAALPGGGVGMIIWIRNNSPAGVANQLRRIVAVTGFGTDIVAINRDWTIIPNATTTYKILNGMLFEIAPYPVTSIVRLFGTAAADSPAGAARVYYDKVFVVNNNTSISATSVQIEIAAETPPLSGAVALDAALTTALADTGSVANRITAPVAGIGLFTPAQPAFISVPGPQNLPAGGTPPTTPNTAGAQGMWLKLSLPAGAAAYKGSVTIRTTAVTT